MSIFENQFPPELFQSQDNNSKKYEFTFANSNREKLKKLYLYGRSNSITVLTLLNNNRIASKKVFEFIFGFLTFLISIK